MQIRSQYVVKMAKEILRTSGITKPPVDLKVIARTNNIDYQEVADFPDTVDALIIEEGGSFVAAVNSRHHVHRQRFSLAHELGHFFLHRNQTFDDEVSIDHPPDGLDGTTGRKSPLEAEADLFAGELLVPVALLKENKTKSISEIARLFVVSEQVAAIAISKHLGTLFK